MEEIGNINKNSENEKTEEKIEEQVEEKKEDKIDDNIKEEKKEEKNNHPTQKKKEEKIDEPKEEKKEKKNIVYFSGLGSFFLSIIIIADIIGAIITIIIYLNFLIDSKKYNFDRIGLTRLGKNTHFSLCSIYSCVDSWYSSFIFNFILLFILLFQDVVISSKWVRLTFIKRAMGDLLFYPKYIIRFMTLFNFCMINMLYQPMNFEDIEVYPKINLSDYFHPMFLLIPLGIGLYLIFSSLNFNIVLNDELGIFLLIKIIKGEQIERLGDYIYGFNIYERIRSPFRGGVMLILLSFSPVWDLGRCLYTLLFWFALYIEGVNDDRYYFERYDVYKEYLKHVPNRFFDFSYITGKKVKRVRIIDDLKDNKKQEEKKEEPVKRRRNKKKQD